MKKIVLPLTLLASISGLTSCAPKTETTPVVESAPQVRVETTTPSEEVTSETPVADPVIIESASGTTVVDPVAPAPTSQDSATKVETVSYMTPAGSDPIEFSMTVAADRVVTAVTVTPKSTNDISKKLQTAFAGEIASKVVGKKLSELNLSAVGGASLTTNAFNTFVKSF